MRKHIFCWLLGITIPFGAYSQKADSIFFSQKRKLEIGVNITSVISNFVGAAEDNVMTPGDFPVTFKILPSPKSAIRLGIGVKSINRREIIAPTQQEPNAQTLINRDNTANMRVGYEWRAHLSRRWMAYGGLDLLGGYILRQSSATAGGEVVLTRTQGTQFGAGPVYGLQFAIAPRLQLGFEGSLYVFSENGTISTTFVNFPELSAKREFQEYNSFLSVPKWLYLVARF
ncbi:MAG: hypothetical protein ACKVTZ_16710 [Bacteroidia bacterium]